VVGRCVERCGIVEQFLFQGLVVCIGQRCGYSYVVFFDSEEPESISVIPKGLHKGTFA
jgi:hypothetical protein